MWFRKSCFCRQNVESNVWGSYRVSRLLRKRTRNLVERVAREAASGKAPQQCGSRTLAFKQRTNTNDLRLQSGYGVGGRRGRDQAPSQIGHRIGAESDHPGHEARDSPRSDPSRARSPRPPSSVRAGGLPLVSAVAREPLATGRSRPTSEWPRRAPSPAGPPSPAPVQCAGPIAARLRAPRARRHPRAAHATAARRARRPHGRASARVAP